MTLCGRSIAVGAMGLALLSVGTAAWAKKSKPKRDAAQVCVADKLKAAGKFELCVLVADAKVFGTSGAPDTGKCETDLSTKWSKIESKANGACPVTGDQAGVQGQLSSDVTALVNAISPPTP